MQLPCFLPEIFNKNIQQLPQKAPYRSGSFPEIPLYPGLPRLFLPFLFRERVKTCPGYSDVDKNGENIEQRR